MATAGFGFSANTDPIMAVKEAIDAAGVPGATFALVSCTVDNDVAAVNDAFVSELPDAQLQGVTSCGNILMAGGAVPGVGCLLFDAPGSFVTAYGEDGGAAAADLKQNGNVLEGTPQAIIMATTPGNEEAAMERIGIECVPGAQFGAQFGAILGRVADDHPRSSGTRARASTARRRRTTSSTARGRC